MLDAIYVVLNKYIHVYDKYRNERHWFCNEIRWRQHEEEQNKSQGLCVAYPRPLDLVIQPITTFEDYVGRDSINLFRQIWQY